MVSRIFLCIVVFIAMCFAGPERVACAADAPQAEAVPDASKDIAAYCGIYCVYAALNCYGRQSEFTKLLQTKYVGSMEGSSIHELKAAVLDNGLQALPMMGLSRANLVAARSPIILHVSRPYAPGYFGHWVLFLGMEDGRAKILDTPHEPELFPIADVLAQWDGVGLYISEQPLSPTWLKVESLLTGENMAMAAALLLATALLQRLLRRRRGQAFESRPAWVSAPAILVAAAIMATAWHLLSADGYARNQVAIRTVIQQHRPSFLPKLSIPEMEGVLNNKNVVIVDARFPKDFKTGHLPGAINIPVFTTQMERRKLLGNVPKDARIIVYCQSEGCQFDEALGSALVAEGIENVSLFPGGWAQWKKSKPEPTEKHEEKR